MKKLFVMYVFLFGIFFSQATIQDIYANTTSDTALRYYVGGKLGYTGLMIDDLKNVTTGKGNKKYSDYRSSMPLGVMAGLQYTFTPLLAMRAELEYLYRLETTSRNRMDFTQYVSSSLATPPTLQNVSDNVDFSLSTQTILANIYLDFLVSERVALYAGVGVGISILDAEIDVTDRVFEFYDDFYPDNSSEKTNVNFAFQVGLGTRIAITKNVFADINARYINMGSLPALGDANLLRVEAKTIHAAEVLVGVSYMF
ncbi:MAG: outer membrane protein [Desulfovibrionaceae bacterium]